MDAQSVKVYLGAYIYNYILNFKLYRSADTDSENVL